jgi:hypothetical protein
MFLEPDEYVVPPTVSRCFALEHYRSRVDPRAEPPFEGIGCAFGTLSYWLEGAMDLDEAVDEELFWSSSSYRHSLANVNLLSYLIGHGDSHPAQFVLTGDATNPRVHLVDSTIAFSDYETRAFRRVGLVECACPRCLARASRGCAVSPRALGRLAVVEQFDVSAGLSSRLDGKRPVRDRPGLALAQRRLADQAPHAGSAAPVRIAAVLAKVERGEIRSF